MKYDEMERVEAVAYPNENVVKQSIRGRKKRVLDIAIVGVVFCVSFALVMLFTTIVSMSASGVLKDVMSAILK